MALTNPGDIVRLRSRNGGRASVYEANAMVQAYTSGLFSGTGVIQNTSPDMNVLVGGSPSNPDIVVAQSAAGYKIALDIVGQQAVLITAPASNSRITSIVAYTDDLSLASTDPDTTGNQSSCGLIAVNGTSGASPSAPTDTQIRTAITADGATGSQAVYSVIANLTVASTTTAITNSLISIVKTAIASAIVLPNNSVGTDQIKSTSVTASKIDFTTFSSDTDFDSGDVAPTFASGFGNSTFADVKFRKIGGRVHMKGAVQKASGNLANGDLFFTLPVGYRPALTGTNEADYLCASSGANIVKVKLLADGSVLCNVTSASVTYVFLNNIIFDT